MKIVLLAGEEARETFFACCLKEEKLSVLVCFSWEEGFKGDIKLYKCGFCLVLLRGCAAVVETQTFAPKETLLCCEREKFPIEKRVDVNNIL